MQAVSACLGYAWRPLMVTLPTDTIPTEFAWTCQAAQWIRALVVIFELATVHDFHAPICKTCWCTHFIGWLFLP